MAGGFTHAMYLDDEAPIAGGREIWGFPKKLATPQMRVEKDAPPGVLDVGSVRVATATMGYKHRAMDPAAAAKALAAPGHLLKLIPHVDCTPRICELVRCRLTEVVLKGACEGPAGLTLADHALAPVARLPVREALSAVHIRADLTLALGEVVRDYLKETLG